MQKKLIALAVAGLASSAAFAQSNVTISGNLDIGYRSHSFGTSNIMDQKTAALHNGSSTSSIVFSGKEDIGGGMTVGFLLNTEPAFGSSATGAAAGTNSLFNSEAYLEVAGGFGSLKAGTVNNTALTVGAATAQPFGTAIGGGYGGTFGRLSRASTTSQGASLTPVGSALPGEGETPAIAATTNGGTSGAILVRNSNSLKYTSPDLSGFKLSIQYGAKNNDTSAAMVNTNTPRSMELGATYNNGPLNVAYVNYQLSQGGVANILAINEKVTHNLIAANYTFGAATVYGGWTSSKADATAGAGGVAASGAAAAVGAGAGYTTADSRSWNLALKYAVTGAVSVMANIVKVDDKLANNQDRSLTGLGVDYALSKRTTAYARYETGDNDKANFASAAVAAGVTVDGKFTRYAVGLRHTF